MSSLVDGAKEVFGRLTPSTTSLLPSNTEQITRNIHEKSWKTYFMELSIPLISLVATGYLMKYILKRSMMDHDDEKEKAAQEAKTKLEQQLKKSGRFTGSIPPTDRYEQSIMTDIIFPHQIDATFDDIGGMELIKESIYETVILPLQSPELFQAMNRENGRSQHSLLSAPRGVLFYGPPGTGKTMMAKAIAKSCAATFINVRSSTLQNKWYGESQKIVRAIFSLAVKFAPSIIFIDEIDGLMRRRGDNDHEVTNLIKGEFMSLWDGLTTETSVQVTVLGCTNRPFDIDKAILRRLPRTFLFDLPDARERTSIVNLLLRDVILATPFPVDQLVMATEGYSGSDLKELCRYAAMLPVRELLKQQRQRDRTSGRSVPGGVEGTPRPISFADFQDALQNVQPTGKTSYEYQKAFSRQEQKQGGQESQAAAAMALGLLAAGLSASAATPSAPSTPQQPTQQAPRSNSNNSSSSSSSSSHQS